MTAVASSVQAEPATNEFPRGAHGRAASGPADGAATRILRAWPEDRPFRVESLLRERPELAGDRSLLVDLAYEEFCRREEAGEGPTPSAFVRNFPEVERSLRRVLALHDFCWNTPEVRDAILPPRWPESGGEVAGFRLETEIGRGAASRVFVARDLELAGRVVVVKLGRGRQEAEAVGVLDHPHVVPVLSARTDPVTGLSLLCMPFLGRATLDAVIDSLYRPEAAAARVGKSKSAADLRAAVAAASAVGGLPRTAASVRPERPWPREFAQAAAGWGAGLAAALAHAHARGVVHSDVKPSNVLVSADGVPMLLDFNLARRSGREAESVGGTLAYMAPERLGAWDRGGPAVSPAADVFSLGATLYELLTGRLPFGPIDERGLRPAAAALGERQRLGPDPIGPDALPPDSPLRVLVTSCLAVDPSARPSAERLAAAFSACASERRRLLSRRRLLVAAAAAGIAAVVGRLATHATPAAPSGQGSGALGHPPGGRPVGADETRVAPAADPAGAWSVGIAAESDGRYADAAAAFTDFLRSDPGNTKGLVARGWCHLREGDHAAAYRDLKAVYDAGPAEAGGDAEDSDPAARGRYDAAFGYAAILFGRDLRRAHAAFTRAMANGFESAATHNDAGFCCLQVEADQLGAARDHFRRSVLLDPAFGPAHHNLALCDLRGVAEAGLPDLRHIRRALALGPRSEPLYVDAALVFSLACGRGADVEAELERACVAAVGCGADPGGLRSLVLGGCPALEGRAWLSSLAAPAGAAAGPSRPARAPGSARVVPPFRDLTELLGSAAGTP